jgi:hypothetical protein
MGKEDDGFQCCSLCVWCCFGFQSRKGVCFEGTRKWVFFWWTWGVGTDLGGADDGSLSKIKKAKSVGTSVMNPIGWQQVLLSHVQSDLPSLDFDLIAKRPPLNG